jgi:hypothetical protein
VATLCVCVCVCVLRVSVWTDQGGRGHRFVSYVYLKYYCNDSSLIYFLLLLLLLNLILKNQSFLTKAKLGNPLPSGEH